MTTSDQEFFDRVYPLLRKTPETAPLEEVEEERKFLFNEMYPDITSPASLVEAMQAVNKANDLKAKYMEIILKLIDWRSEFRASGQWERADEIRDMLKESGVILQDKVSGTIWEWADT